MVYTVIPKESPCWFTSIGMFIIDENRFAPSTKKEPIRDIIGGGLTFAVIGARMIAGKTNGPKVSGIVDKGSDFPDSVEEQIKSWNTGLIFREDPTRLTTRGVNNYLESGVREFFYHAPKKRIEAIDILSYDRLLHSKSFHLVCTTERCEQIIDIILSNLPKDSDQPFFLWEPTPDDCKPENYEALCKLLPKIDVFTPNLIESQNFIEKTDVEMETDKIKSFVDSTFLPYLTKKNSGIALRCGARGCYIRTPDVDVLLPAFHDNQELVIDPTGGGNSFCGGFMIGLLLSNLDWVAAAICANLVSGCVVEHLGVPTLTGDDTWNGKTMQTRLHEYLAKFPELKSYQSKIGWL
ncbi:protein Mak32p [[Candida] anglica]|uniref:Protein Mak32p n=1 Tax=[Candida] anglica TaxID=148631 RepID=A0ABP0EIH4_9ASCO